MGWRSARCGRLAATFLIFSDYARPAIRLAAFMQLPVIYVFTHDSLEMGQDGPTHQPIEQLASLRAIPGLITLRPGRRERSRRGVARRHALEARAGGAGSFPTGAAHARSLGLRARVGRGAGGVRPGRCARREARRPVAATGSEVALCIAAYEELKAEGVKARVVSMPSWELFEHQSREYRDSVIPPAVTARVAVEAASTFGWERYAGSGGAIIGMRTFGVSAPLKDLKRKFGFEPAHVVRAAREQIAGQSLGQREIVRMQLGMLGLGRMGSSMVRRLIKAGHECVVYDVHPEPGKALEKDGAVAAASLEDFVKRLIAPRAVWLMLPAGVVDDELAALVPLLDAGDTVIDGGNSHYHGDIRRAKELKPKNIHYVDVGTSGGVWGLEQGYCLMIGGDDDVVRHLDPIFAALAPGIEAAPRTDGREKLDGTAEQGYLHCGSNGAGHFVKMVHNGIEYGLMAAYAEGLNVLQNADIGIRSRETNAETTPLTDPEYYQYALDIRDIAEVWRRGSVIRSWLLDLTASSLVQRSGSRWLRRACVRLGRGTLDDCRRD